MARGAISLGVSFRVGCPRGGGVGGVRGLGARVGKWSPLWDCVRRVRAGLGRALLEQPAEFFVQPWAGPA